MQNYVMAIDQGTTSTRAILFDQQSNISSELPKRNWKITILILVG